MIDYENVGGNGLAGCNTLTGTDRIIIFLTQNAKKFDIRGIADHGEAGIKMIEIPAGKQSSNIHIGSFLGYLAGKNKGKDCKIVIISKDKNFDAVLRFWESTTGVKSCRAERIRPAAPKGRAEKQVRTKFDIPVEDPLHLEIREVLLQNGVSAENAAETADAVLRMRNEKDAKQQVYKTLVAVHGQDEGLRIYKCIKKKIR